MSLSQPMDCNGSAKDQSNNNESNSEFASPRKSISKMNNNNLVVYTPKSKHNFIKRPVSSIRRLSIRPVSQRPSLSPANSIKSTSRICTRKNKAIKRPQKSIARTIRTKKLLSAPTSISNNLLNDDIFNIRINDEYPDHESVKSIDSKLSFISSPTSNSSVRSSFTNRSNRRSKCMTALNKDDENKIKLLKFKNARIHLEIEQIKKEKEFYFNVVKSIKNIITQSQYNNDSLANELDSIINTSYN